MVLELWVTLPLPSIERFTSKCLVEFFSGSSWQARGQSCPTILSLTGRGWSWTGKLPVCSLLLLLSLRGATIPLP